MVNDKVAQIFNAGIVCKSGYGSFFFITREGESFFHPYISTSKIIINSGINFFLIFLTEEKYLY